MIVSIFQLHTFKDRSQYFFPTVVCKINLSISFFFFKRSNKKAFNLQVLSKVDETVRLVPET